jgi:hypothetical protein
MVHFVRMPKAFDHADGWSLLGVCGDEQGKECEDDYRKDHGLVLASQGQCDGSRGVPPPPSITPKGLEKLRETARLVTLWSATSLCIRQKTEISSQGKPPSAD